MSSYFGCFPLELGEIIVARQMVDKFDANTLGKLDAKLYCYTTHRKMRNDEKKIAWLCHWYDKVHKFPFKQV